MPGGAVGHYSTGVLLGDIMAEPRLRAGDDDRADTCAVLDKAYAAGQLDINEHETRVRQAISAATVGDLAALVADLRIPEHTPPPRRGMRRAVLATVAAGLVVVSSVVIGFVAGRDSRPSPSAGPVGIDARIEFPVHTSTPRLDTVDGLNTLIAAARSEFGHTIVTHLVVLPDKADLSVSAARSRIHIASEYTYAGGHFGLTIRGVGAVDGPEVDISRIDLPKIVELLAQAPKTLDIADPNAVWFEVSGAGGGTVTIHATNVHGKAGAIDFGLDGTPKR